MKVEFLEDDFKFYLGKNMRKMHKSKKGDSIEVDAETAERWIKKSVAKMAGKKAEVKPADIVEIKGELPEPDKKEFKNRVKRGRKKKIQ